MPAPTPRLAFLHTAPVVAPVFAALARELLPEVEAVHLVDESLIRDTIRAGRLRPRTYRQVLALAQSAADAGAGAVLATCSSIGPAVEWARAGLDVPLLRVDEAMADEAVRLAAGRPVGVAATLSTTLAPTAALIRARAAAAGVECSLVERLCEGAFEAVSAGDGARHDRLVREGLRDLASRAAVVVLAQASMARVADALGDGERPVPILSSPRLGVLRARRELGLADLPSQA